MTVCTITPTKDILKQMDKIRPLLVQKIQKCAQEYYDQELGKIEKRREEGTFKFTIDCCVRYFQVLTT